MEAVSWKFLNIETGLSYIGWYIREAGAVRWEQLFYRSTKMLLSSKATEKPCLEKQRKKKKKEWLFWRAGTNPG